MAVYTSEPVSPTLIDNTTMVKNFKDGVATTYYITPVDGYVLHDTTFDYHECDDEGNLTGVVVLGYRTSTASCSVSYNFTANPREFYAVPADSVPADQIFGSVDNDHVVA